MLGVINYSACGGIAGREFYSKAILTHYLYSSPSLKKKCWGEDRGEKNNNNIFDFLNHGQMVSIFKDC